MSNDNQWILDAHLNVRGRLIEVYVLGDQVKLQYKDTGKVIWAGVISADSSTRERYRHIVETLSPLVNKELNE